MGRADPFWSDGWSMLSSLTTVFPRSTLVTSGFSQGERSDLLVCEGSVFVWSSSCSLHVTVTVCLCGVWTAADGGEQSVPLQVKHFQLLTARKSPKVLRYVEG